MLKREKVLWRQLNGPQITAIENTLWDYQIAKYDAILDYLEKLSIETANSAHLDFIGKLMKIPRALIVTEKYFDDLLLFSAKNGADVYNAFSGFVNGEWRDVSVFGFSDAFPGDHLQLIDDYMYRKILTALARAEGSAKGIEFIDYLCGEFLVHTGANGDTPLYYDIIEDPNVVGDIHIIIQNTAGYKQIVLQQVFNQLFSSVPKVTIYLEGTNA